VRDLDGVLRDVERYGPTKAKAEATLTRALRERVTPSAAEAGLTPDSLVADAAALWWTEVQANGRHSINTRRAYEGAMRRHLVGSDEEPAHLAHLALREVRASTVDRRLRDVAKGNGEAAAKMTRTVLRGVLDLAVRHDAIAANPVRALGAVTAPRDDSKPAKAKPRAFTAEECAAVLAFADDDERAQRRDLPDLLAFLAGTGARIGEACALRWSALELGKGTADLGPVVVRVTGEGLVVQERAKTHTSARTVHLPPRLVARLLARQVEAPSNAHDVVFPAPRSLALRDPSNTGHDVRDLLTDAGHAWATAHTFRKTVATTLLAGGVPGVDVSNQLGHARPSMTTDVYADRLRAPKRAAQLL